MPAVSDPRADLIARIATLEAKVDELSRAPGQAVSNIRDAQDNVVVTQAQGGMLARPYLPIEFGTRQPYITWIRSTSLVWESLLRAHIVKQHPGFSAIICGISGPGAGGATDGSQNGGSGYLRLTVNGTPALPDFRVAQNSSGFETPIGPIALPGDHLDPVIIELWGKSDWTNVWIAAQIFNGYAREFDPPAALASSGTQTATGIDPAAGTSGA